MIEVFVESIRVNMTNYKRVVMLKEKAGARYLPIWIGHFEADAIAIPMQNVPVNRPLTHDMLVSAVSQLGGRCLWAAITRLENETFYATLLTDQQGRNVEIDCRPSDAIATAIRLKVPIYVEDAVMDLAGMDFPPDQGTPPAEGSSTSAVAQAEEIITAATAAQTGVPSVGAEDEPADTPSEMAPYMPGAELADGPAPKPFDALQAVSAPVQAALRRTIRTALQRRQRMIGPGDLLVGLLGQRDASATRVLADLSVDVDELQTLVRRELGRDHQMISLTAAGQAVLMRAQEEASRLDESTVSAEHLLLALAGEAEGSVPFALEQIGLTQPAIRRQIAVLLAQAAEQDEA